MTNQTPIERAMESINSKVEEIYAFEKMPTILDLAKAAFDSIDVEQLARVIHAWDVKDGPCEGAFDNLTDTQKDVWRSAAHAVKNWLTGKDQQ